MESSPLTKQDRPTSFEPKISQLYNDLFRSYDEEVTFSDGFWREFFLLKPDKVRLQRKIEDLSASDLLHLQTETQQLFAKAISEIREGKSPADEHAIDTVTVFLGAVFSKKYTNPSSDTITVIAGLDEVDTVMPEFSDAIESCVRNGRNPAIREQALNTALSLTAGAYQTSLVSYFSYRDLFPALMKELITLEQYTQDSEPPNLNSTAMLLLGLLANYNKFEFRNPYRVRLEDFVNESIMIKIVRDLGVTFAKSRARYVTLQEDIAESWSLSSALNYIGLGMLAPNRAVAPQVPKVEDMKEDFSDLPDSNAAVLLAAFEFTVANKIFCFNLVSCAEEPKGSEAPFSAFLSFTSYILHHAYRSPRAIIYGSLNLLILRIIIEDLAICKLLFDAERPLAVRLCRQRQPMLPATPKPRPAGAAILDILIDTINHNLRRNLDIQLYISVLSTIHRLLSYVAFTRTRLSYHWPLLWQTLLTFVKFLTTYASNFNAQSLDLGILIKPLLASLALSVLSGESFLPSTSAYDDLFYKLVESGEYLERFKNAFSTHLTPSADSLNSQDAPASNGSPNSPIDILIQVSTHYYELVEDEKGKGRVGKNLSPREVSKVIKQGYDSLSLPGMEGLDRWDRFREGDERNSLKRAARMAVDDARRLLKAP